MIFKVPEKKIIYSTEPGDENEYTRKFDKAYSRYAKAYDLAVKCLPFWKTWIRSVIPHIEGPKVLEASFGTGYLLSRYASEFETYGIDLNLKMIETARRNLRRKGIAANLQQANVNQLPFPDACFNTVINTMAFSGYPDGKQAMSEFFRVLKQNGHLLIVDFGFPSNRNRFGYWMTKLMEFLGDTIRDLAEIIQEFDLEFVEKEIGGFGSVHLIVAKKKDIPERSRDMPDGKHTGRSEPSA